ncbi:MAG TPA: hypothetical protein V6C69_22270 [Trichormus sp.]
MKSLCVRMIVLLALCLTALPCYAGNANSQREDQLFNQAAANFHQHNYVPAFNQMRDACALLHSDPASEDGADYLDIAGKTITNFVGATQNLHFNNDLAGMAEVSTRVSAAQPLLQACMEWDPNNPRWHYLSGMLYRAASAALGDKYAVYLQQANGEFNRAIAMPAGGEFQEKAQAELAKSTGIVDQRRADMQQWQRTHPQPKGGMAAPSSPGLVVCGNCGFRHSVGEKCAICGSWSTR